MRSRAAFDDHAVILVIDDETTVCRIISSILEREGLHCEAAHDGQTGMEMAAEHSPSLVILDLFLPDLDGMEILQQLRLWYKVPILVISGRGEFLARRMLDKIKLKANVVSLTRELGPELSRCAPAHALAVLAREGSR